MTKTMTKILIAAFLLALSASRAQAQTHYCDTVPPATGTGIVGATMTIQHCNDGKDSTGTVNVTPTSFKLYDNSAVGVTITMTRGTTSAVSGKTVYTGTYVVPATPGAHTLQTSALVGTTESAKSPVFTLTAVAAVPSAPTNLSVQ